MMEGLSAFLLLHVLTWLGQSAHGSQIINGNDVPEKSMLYMVSVQSKNGHKCGGFLISEEFVVTAAHCDMSKPTQVVFGTHNLKKANNNTIRRIVNSCLHPSYKNAGSGNDIMLLRLEKKVPMGKTVNVIKLSSKKIKDNQKCSVDGWGFTKSGGKSDVLKTVDVSIINKKECEKAWGKVNKKLPGSIICAGGYNTDKGFCKGDSGGPLVCNGLAAGVVSFNLRDNCEYPNAPNIYTDISKHITWIKKVLKKKQC